MMGMRSKAIAAAGIIVVAVVGRAAGFSRGNAELSAAPLTDYRSYGLHDIGPKAYFYVDTYVTVKLYPNTPGQFDTVARVATTSFTPVL